MSSFKIIIEYFEYQLGYHMIIFPDLFFLRYRPMDMLLEVLKENYILFSFFLILVCCYTFILLVWFYLLVFWSFCLVDEAGAPKYLYER